jgi:hypothetical protein
LTQYVILISRKGGNMELDTMALFLSIGAMGALFKLYDMF